MADRRRHERYRYGAWRGGADPLAPPFDVRPALDALGERVLGGEGIREALRELLREGLPDGDRRRPGLDELRERARRRRRDLARSGRLDGELTRARAALDQALAAERETLAGRDDDDARLAEAQLDSLPRSVAGAVRELDGYRWASQEAERTYQDLLRSLREEVLGQQFGGLRDALAAMGPDADAGQRQQATEGLADMLRDLNDLLARHARGEDTDAAFADFMDRHGRFFPDEPESVDELVDSLARAAAAAQRLLASLTPRQREELQDLLASAVGDPGLAAQLAELADTLQALRPELRRGRGEGFRGGEGLGYAAATDALAELSDLDDVLDALGQDYPGATLDDVDVEAVERALGAGARQDVEALRQLERELERQGWLVRDRDGLTLAPKALRRLGQTALREVFAHLRRGSSGEHDLPDAGGAGEPTGASRTWEFGDEQPLDVVRTVRNAVARRAAHPAGAPAGGLRLAVDDFEVVETQRRSRAVVALCVDLSYSMISEGRWAPMKQTALALAHLVATRYPQDALQIIGFGRQASRLSVEQLAGVEPDYVQGTNLQHALMIAGRHLRRHPDAEPLVLVVTDGEPTAHLVPGGGATFSWPPTRDTVAATLAEVDALTRFGAPVNVFLLGDDPGLRRFMDAVARRNGGRVLTPSTDRLGEFVVADYVRSRRGRR